MYNNHNTFLPASKFDCNCHFKKMQGVKKKLPANFCKKMCGKVAGAAFVCLVIIMMIDVALSIIVLAHTPADNSTLAPVVTVSPTLRPTTLYPSSHPTTSRPSKVPSRTPSRSPSKVPSGGPTRSPTPPTLAPTKSPTTPTIFVPVAITTEPTSSPTAFPTTAAPTTAQPSHQPSRTPSWSPSQQPSKNPSKTPSKNPSKSPTPPTTPQPSKTPSRTPSLSPSRTPSKTPSKTPTTPAPTLAPTTKAPTGAPTPATTVNILFGAGVGLVDGGYTESQAQTACDTAAPSVPGLKVSTCTSASQFRSTAAVSQASFLSAGGVFGRDGTQISTSKTTFYSTALVNSLSAAGVCTTDYWSGADQFGAMQWSCYSNDFQTAWATASGGSYSNTPQGGIIGSCTSTVAAATTSAGSDIGVSCTTTHELVCVCQGLTLF